MRYAVKVSDRATHPYSLNLDTRIVHIEADGFKVEHGSLVFITKSKHPGVLPRHTRAFSAHHQWEVWEDPEPKPEEPAVAKVSSQTKASMAQPQFFEAARRLKSFKEDLKQHFAFTGALGRTYHDRDFPETVTDLVNDITTVLESYYG